MQPSTLTRKTGRSAKSLWVPTAKMIFTTGSPLDGPLAGPKWLLSSPSPHRLLAPRGRAPSFGNK